LAADWFETLREPWICAVTLTVGAVGMMVAERWRAHSRLAEGIGLGEALAIGVGQALALFPGMSRSGTTITIAMLLGIQRQDAARFTFLMSVPAVVAAVGREGLVLAVSGVDGGEIGLFVVGIGVSAVVGYLAISRLIRYLAGHSLDAFAHYRYALAAATVVWLVAR